MRCNVCNKDKELNQFQTYWHSTQNKMRTRKQCTECLYQIRLKRKNPDKFYENNPDYHKCNTCNNWKVKNEFYTNDDNEIYSNRCRQCEREKERTKRQEYLADNCGSDKVLMTPNCYADEYQKNCTFTVMERMGYQFDEQSGIWIKPGYKEVKDGKPHFLTIKHVRPYTKGSPVTTKLIQDIIYYKLKGYTNRDISKELRLSETTVWKYLKEWKSQLKSGN